MRKITIILSVFAFVVATTVAQNKVNSDKRAKIKDYLNLVIGIEDNFAGQSITLTKENKNYFVFRQYNGSGVPIIGFAKYKVVFDSDYQITFSEIIDVSHSDFRKQNEVFRLVVAESGLNLYLNGLKVAVFV
jgi:hypothetical protein